MSNYDLDFYNRINTLLGNQHRTGLYDINSLEGLDGDAVVEPLHPHVGPQELETLAVALPEELDPGHEDGAVRPVLGALPRHGGQHDHLRRRDVLKIINLKGKWDQVG